MPRKAAWPPKIQKHKSGRARVRINGVDHYLGEYGSEEATAEFFKLVKRIEDERAGRSIAPVSKAIDVGDLAGIYIEHQKRERKDEHGNPTEEMGHIERALRAMVHAIGDMPAREVSPRHIKEVRSLFLNGYVHPNPKFGKKHPETKLGGWHRPQARKSVNQNFGRVRAVFKWAGEEGLIPAEIYYRLSLIRGVRPGENGAKDMPDVPPVPEGDLTKTMPHLGPVVREMVEIQLLTACRPGEVCRLCPSELDRSGAVWKWRPPKHKNAWRGHSKLILIGPKAQSILTHFLDRDPESACFSPREAAEKSGQNWRARKDGRGPTEQYRVNSYEQAIERACLRAKVAHWKPGQLRHNAATRLEEQFGLEVARLLLGHKHLQTTKIYARDNLEKAEQAAKTYG